MELNPKDFINAKEAFMPTTKPKLAPKVDITLSKLAGKTILANDPRVLRLIVEFKRKTKRIQETKYDVNGKMFTIESNDNFQNNPEFIKALKNI